MRNIYVDFIILVLVILRFEYILPLLYKRVVDKTCTTVLQVQLQALARINIYLQLYLQHCSCGRWNQYCGDECCSHFQTGKLKRKEMIQKHKYGKYSAYTKGKLNVQPLQAPLCVERMCQPNEILNKCIRIHVTMSFSPLHSSQAYSTKIMP